MPRKRRLALKDIPEDALEAIANLTDDDLDRAAADVMAREGGVDRNSAYLFMKTVAAIDDNRDGDDTCH